MVDIPPHPTKADAKAALGLLLGLIGEFPFVDEVRKSVALELVVELGQRSHLLVRPLHELSPKLGMTSDEDFPI